MRPFKQTPLRLLQAGFTLIELMVALVSIGVLAALLVPNVLDRAEDTRVMAARSDVANIMQAVKLYKLDSQRAPTSAQSLQALLTKPTIGPRGKPHPYLNPGGKGKNAEVGRWQ